MPRQYLIDGYNLAFAWGAARQAMLIDKQKGREKLLELLTGFKRAAGCGITVVFDGREGHGEGGGSVRGIRVAYAKRPVTADEEIYRLVSGSRDRGSLTVVSSDRQVAGFARRNGASSMGAGDFAARAEKAMRRSSKDAEKPDTVDVDEWAEYFGASRD